MQQHAGPTAEQETAERTERKRTTTRDSAEGETSQIQAQPHMSPQTEEPVAMVTSDPGEPEPEPTPQENKDPQKAASTRELAGADTITQQP